MIFGLVLTVHILLAVFLIGIILIQGGRGGLGEALGGAAAQSLFGGGANVVMTKLTAFVGALFMVTSLSLAMLSTARGRSVVEQVPVTEATGPFAVPKPPEPEPAQPLEPSIPHDAPLSTTAPAETTP